MGEVTDLSERRKGASGSGNRECGGCGGQWFTVTGQVVFAADEPRITGWVVRIPGAEPFTASGRARPGAEVVCADCGAAEPLGGRGWPLG